MEELIVKYNLPMRIMHWGSGLLFILTLIFGMILAQTKWLDANIGNYIDRHKSLGISLLILVTLRIIIRVFSKIPPAIEKTKLEFYLAKFTHYALYFLLIAIPIDGYLMSSFSGRSKFLDFFGILKIPYIFEANKELAGLFYQFHSILAYSALILIILHILASFKYLLFNKMNILKRII